MRAAGRCMPGGAEAAVRIRGAPAVKTIPSSHVCLPTILPNCTLLTSLACCRHRRTYTDGGCYLKSGSEWSQESREGVISGYLS